MRRTAYRLNAPPRETYLLWQVPQTVLWRTLSRDGRLLYPRTPASETLRRLLYPRTTCRSRGSSAGSAPRVILQVYHDRVAFTVTSACRESTRSGRPRLSVQLWRSLPNSRSRGRRSPLESAPINITPRGKRRENAVWAVRRAEAAPLSGRCRSPGHLFARRAAGNRSPDGVGRPQ